MNNFLTSFLMGLSCTLFLFVLSVILVLGVKMLVLMVKDLRSPQQISQPQKKRKRTRANPKPKQATVVRSIEIDPSQVDKIYVKKSS